MPGALAAAAGIGLADASQTVPSYPALAHRLGVQEDPLRRLARFLISIGLLEPALPDGVALSAVGHVLRSDDPRGVHWRAMNVHLSHAVLALEHSIRTGEPAYDEVFGEGLWDRLAHHAEDRHAFDQFMARLAANLNVPAVLAWDWSASRRVVDVGGGVGVVLQAVLRAHPHLEGTLVDGPMSIAGAERQMAAAGLADRVELRARDMFGDELPPADTYVLSRVLHDFDDEPASRLLRSIRRSIEPGGHVLIVDGVVPDDPVTHPMLSSDLRMLAYQSGRERTWSQFDALLGGSGFELVDRLGPDVAGVPARGPTRLTVPRSGISAVR